jgi:hypothetical protein
MNSPQEHKCIDEQQLIDNVNTYGWTVMIIPATDYLPSFAYTVGLWKSYNHPELISFGFTTKTLHAILNIGGELIKKGQILRPEREYHDFFDGGAAQFIEVNSTHIKDYFSYAIWFNGTMDFPSLQLVWTDRNGKYPWDEGFEEEFVYKQPLLDRGVDFKFRESRNLGVFTTRQWLEEKKPIVRVVHDEDGDWQFLTGDQLLEDARIVSLEEIINRDATINDVFNLDYGQEAERKFIGDRWIRSSTSVTE